MRFDSTDWLQVWRTSQRLWSEGPRVTVKLEQDLTPMNRCNSEEQVMSIMMMIWSGSYRLWYYWFMCCINIRGDGIECARHRYICRAFYFTGHRCVEKFMIGFRIDDVHQEGQTCLHVGYLVPLEWSNFTSLLVKGSRCPREGWIGLILKFKVVIKTTSPFHPSMPFMCFLAIYRDKSFAL